MVSDDRITTDIGKSDRKIQNPEGYRPLRHRRDNMLYANRDLIGWSLAYEGHRSTGVYYVLPAPLELWQPRTQD